MKEQSLWIWETTQQVKLQKRGNKLCNIENALEEGWLDPGSQTGVDLNETNSIIFRIQFLFI